MNHKIIMSELNPKPPEILQKIKWLHLYGKKYWGYVIISLAFLIGTWLLDSPHIARYRTKKITKNSTNIINTTDSAINIKKYNVKDKCENCDELYELALSDIKNNHLTTPQANNALQKYNLLKKKEYDKSKIIKEKIIDKYNSLINWNIVNGNINNAKTLLKRLEIVDSTIDINVFKNKIKEYERNKKIIPTKEYNEIAKTINLKVTKQETPSEGWIKATCCALNSATMDAAKVAIIKSSVANRSISGNNLHRLYLCGNFTMDIAKINSIELLVKKMHNGSFISANQFTDIIETITMDTGKKDISAKLLPLIK